MDISPDFVVSVLGVVILALLMWPVAVRWSNKTEAAVIFWLSGYLLVGLWQYAALIGAAVAAPTMPVPAAIFAAGAHFGQVILPLVFGGLTLAFTRQAKKWLWSYGLLSLPAAGLWLALFNNSAGITDRLMDAAPLPLSMDNAVNSVAVVLWLAGTITALGSIGRSLRKYPLAQSRNRFRYWLGSIISLSVAAILWLFQNPQINWVAAGLHLTGSLLAAYIVMRTHPPDLKFVANRFFQSTVVALGVGVVLFGALNLAYLLNTWAVPTHFVLLWLGGLALGLGAIMPALSRRLATGLEAVFFGSNRDETSLMAAYNHYVQSDWSFNKLSRQALEFILKEMKLDRGALFIDESDGSGNVIFKQVAYTSMAQPNIGYFAAGTPFVAHLRQTETPLTRYDLDVLPRYQTMDEPAKTWLTDLEADIFLPLVLRRRGMMGLLALGPKPGHQSFTPNDLARLQLVAAQVALDLDKARLFGKLGQANKRLGQISTEFKTLDKGKQDFLSIASHELRTPLTHIHGYTSMLLEASEQDLKDPAFLRLILDGIANGSTRLKDVVDLMFDVTKADVGTLDVLKGAVNLNSVVQEALESQRAFIKERHHTFMALGLADLPTIEGDAAWLAQGIAQILNNAIKYSPDGGSITIKGRKIPATGQPQQVELIISDTGIGIDPQDHRRIFDKFYRAADVDHHSTSKVKFKGAGPGLGLSLVAGIVKAHHGEIWAESAGHDEETCPGSAFHILLPVKLPAATQPKESQTPSLTETRHWRRHAESGE